MCVFYLARSFPIVLGGQVAGAVCRIMARLFHMKKLLFQTLALGKREKWDYLNALNQNLPRLLDQLKDTCFCINYSTQAEMMLNDSIRSLSMHCFCTVGQMFLRNFHHALWNTIVFSFLRSGGYYLDRITETAKHWWTNTIRIF